METTPEHGEPSLEVNVLGGNGVQAGSGNQQYNQHIVINVPSNASAELAVKSLAWGPESRPIAGSTDGSAVPRTRAQLEKTIKDRPRAWEYLLFVGAMLIEMHDLDDRYSDYLIGYAPRSGIMISSANFIEFYKMQLGELRSIADLFDQILRTEVVEGAIGAPGIPGDPARIRHLAKRIISVYGELLLWTERLKGVQVPAKYRNLIAILARYSEQPIAELRNFVEFYAEQVEGIPKALIEGRSVKMEFVVKWRISPDVSEALRNEFSRIR